MRFVEFDLDTLEPTSPIMQGTDSSPSVYNLSTDVESDYSDQGEFNFYEIDDYIILIKMRPISNICISCMC